MYIDMDMFESNVSCLVDRSYCGAAKQFHGRHISDAVFMIPPGTNKDDFFLSVPEHEEQLQYGRVLLFFKLALVSSTSMRNDVDLAFVEYLDKYIVNGNVLWKYLLQPAFLWKRCITLNINVYWYICCIFCFIEADQLTALGHIRLYEPSKTCFEVIPVSYIIGKLPMMPDFGNPTIPYRLRRCTMAFLLFGFLTFCELTNCLTHSKTSAFQAWCNQHNDEDSEEEEKRQKNSRGTRKIDATRNKGKTL